MPTVNIYNANHEKTGELSLSDAVFGAEVKEHLFYAVVRQQRAARRAGTHATKGRAEVSGGGKKPWKQKGTGRARQGSIRSPQWRGGGVVFGPQPRKYEFKLNRKVRQAALRGALSRRVQENALVVLDALSFPETRTRQVVELMKRFELSEMLVVLAGTDTNVERSARNIQGVTVIPAKGLNVYDVLNHSALVITRDAVDAVTARLTPSPSTAVDDGVTSPVLGVE